MLWRCFFCGIDQLKQLYCYSWIERELHVVARAARRERQPPTHEVFRVNFLWSNLSQDTGPGLNWTIFWREKTICILTRPLAANREQTVGPTRLGTTDIYVSELDFSPLYHTLASQQRLKSSRTEHTDPLALLLLLRLPVSKPALSTEHTQSGDQTQIDKADRKHTNRFTLIAG